jgi:hypothetical protein
MVRRGGWIEVIHLEGDLMTPLRIDAVGSSYFRLPFPVDGKNGNLSSSPIEKPLGSPYDDYFLLAYMPIWKEK